MWRVTLVLALAGLLALCAPAGAKVVLLDGDGAIVATPVADAYTTLFGWTDDGTALLVRRYERMQRVDLATGSMVALPQLDHAVSVGPGGRAIVTRYRPGGLSVELREADGRVVGAQLLPAPRLFASAAWSPDGTRVAVAAPPSLVVFDTFSGAPVLRATVALGKLPSQAFAPDGNALLVVDWQRVLRIDLPSGNQSVVLRAPRHGFPPTAAWAPDGRIAVTHDDRVRFSGTPPIEARIPAYVTSAFWTKDASALTYTFVAGSGHACQEGHRGLALLAPGGEQRLLGPRGVDVLSAQPSPDGQTLAVELYDDDSERRGARHPWPKRIARHYDMSSPRGDAAIRRVVLRASRALRRGAGRAEALGGVSEDLQRLDNRFGEVHDTVVGEAIAAELDKWLKAAGLTTIDARDEFDC